jgi:hypothetical protein
MDAVLRQLASRVGMTLLVFGLMSQLEAPRPVSASAKLAPEVRAQAERPELGTFTVQFSRPATAADLAALEQAGALIKRRDPRQPVAAVSVPGTALRTIAALPIVTRINREL